MRKQKKWVIRESGPHWKDADKDCGLQVEKKISRKKKLNRYKMRDNRRERYGLKLFEKKNQFMK